MKTNKIKKIFKSILLGIVICFSCLSVPRIEASDIERYVGIVLYNPTSNQLDYRIYKKDANNLKKTALMLCSESDGLVGSKVCNLQSEGSKYNLNLQGIGGSDTFNGAGMFIFPFTPISNTQVSASYSDYSQAQKVLGTLVGDFNIILKKVLSDSQFSGKNQIENASIAIANASKNAMAGSSGKIGNGVYYTSYASAKNNDAFAKNIAEIEKNVKSSAGTASQGLDVNDYIIIYSLDSSGKVENPIALIASYPIGYASNQILAGRVERLEDGVRTKATWGDLVTIASSAYHSNKKGSISTDTDGFETLAQNGAITTALNEFVDNIIDTISVRTLGFYSLESMMLNREARGQSYYLGMMPYEWFSKANTVFWIAEIIAVFILIASILYTVYQENYAIVSPSVRINLQDRVQNLLIAILLLIMYVPLFYILGKFNQSIVELLNSLVGNADFSYSMNLNFFLNLILAIVNLAIMIKLNFDYLVRALTITVLHIISPIAIASISVSEGQNRKYFNIWLKELVSAIFMQSFDAVILVLFMLMLKGGNGIGRWWEIAFMSFMFVPLNKWFKSTFGGGDSVGKIADQTRKGASGALQNTLNTAAIGMGMVRNGFKSSKGGNSADGGSDNGEYNSADTSSDASSKRNSQNNGGKSNSTKDDLKTKVVTMAYGVGEKIPDPVKTGAKTAGRAVGTTAKVAGTTAKFVGASTATALGSSGLAKEISSLGGSSHLNTKSNVQQQEEVRKQNAKQEKTSIDIGQYKLKGQEVEKYNHDLDSYRQHLDEAQEKLEKEEEASTKNDKTAFNPDYTKLVDENDYKDYAQSQGISEEEAKTTLNNIMSDNTKNIAERKTELAQTVTNAKYNSNTQKQEKAIQRESYNKAYQSISGKDEFEVGKKAIDEAQKISNGSQKYYSKNFEKPFNEIANNKDLSKDQKQQKYAEVLAKQQTQALLEQKGITKKETDKGSPLNLFA